MNNTVKQAFEGIEMAEDTAAHVRQYVTAARKLEKLLVEIATHGDDYNRTKTNAAYRAVSKLDERSNKAEIRGNDDVREICWRIQRWFRASVRYSNECRESVLRAQRDIEIARLNAEIREQRIASRDWRSAPCPYL